MPGLICLTVTRSYSLGQARSQDFQKGDYIINGIGCRSMRPQRARGGVGAVGGFPPSRAKRGSSESIPFLKALEWPR